MPKALPDAIIERLCGHLHTELFEIEGDDENDYEFLKLDFDNYRRRFSDGDETVVFVLLAEASQVVGFIAIRDLDVPKAGRRYLSIPAAAMAEGWTGGNGGFRLIMKALSVGHVRNRAHFEDTGHLRYHGIACVPWTKELRVVLERQHFVPLEGTLFWIRPYKRGRQT